MELLKNESSALSIYHLSSLLVIDACPEWFSNPPTLHHLHLSGCVLASFSLRFVDVPPGRLG